MQQHMETNQEKNTSADLADNTANVQTENYNSMIQITRLLYQIVMAKGPLKHNTSGQYQNRLIT